MIQEAEIQIRKYFRVCGWSSISDDKGNAYFYKNRHPNQIKGGDFLGYSKKKGYVSDLEVVSILEEGLSESYERKNTNDIVRPDGSTTFFITSGIQHFENILFNGEIPNEGPSFFVQPVIRTNYRDSVGEGRVSSFVNLSTVRFNCSLDQYIEDLDGWMDSLSKLGLYMGDFIFKLKHRKVDLESDNFWRKNEGLGVSCSYGGLGLGDASYHSLTGQEDKPFEDIGFGLERIVWARNKNPTFVEVVGVFPYAFLQNILEIDTLRTISFLRLFRPRRVLLWLQVSWTLGLLSS